MDTKITREVINIASELGELTVIIMREFEDLYGEPTSILEIHLAAFKAEMARINPSYDVKSYEIQIRSFFDQTGLAIWVAEEILARMSFSQVAAIVSGGGTSALLEDDAELLVECVSRGVVEYLVALLDVQPEPEPEQEPKTSRVVHLV